MTNLTITFSQALAAQGKSLKQAKPLGAAITDMIIDDEAHGSALYQETLLYLDDTPDPDTGLKHNGSGCLGFAKANVVFKWKNKYSKWLSGYVFSDYEMWQHLNKKLKKAGVLEKGKTAPSVKAIIAEAKAAELVAPVEAPAEESEPAE